MEYDARRQKTNKNSQRMESELCTKNALKDMEELKS